MIALVAGTFAEQAPFLLPPLLVLGLLIVYVVFFLPRAGEAVLTVPVVADQPFALRHTVAVPGEYSLWIRYEVLCAYVQRRPHLELFLDLLITCPDGQVKSERIRLGQRLSDSPAADPEGMSHALMTTATGDQASHVALEQARIVGTLPPGATLEVAGTLGAGAGTRLIAAAASLRRTKSRG